MKRNMILGITLMAIMALIACNKGGSSGSASGGRVQSNPESDFEAKAIDGGKGVEITKYIGDKWEVGIPSKIRDLPVTNIGGYVFHGKSLIRVTIPDSVTTIGREAFMDNQLTSVTIPNSVTTIGNAAFLGNQLTSVTIPNSITTIVAQAFERNQLTNVTIPNSVTVIEWGAFADNQLTSVTIGANVIADSAFFNNATGDIGFVKAYNNAGKAAGTYTRPNTDSTTWTKQ
jgi:hypothetical protein